MELQPDLRRLDIFQLHIDSAAHVWIDIRLLLGNFGLPTTFPLLQSIVYTSVQRNVSWVTFSGRFNYYATDNKDGFTSF